MTPSRPSRRRVIAGIGGGVLSVAGCLERTPDGAPEQSPTDTPIYHTGGSSYLELSAAPADLEAEWAHHYGDLDAEHQRILEEALSEDRATFETWIGPPLDEGSYVERDGTYHRVEESVADQRTVTTHRFELETLTVDGQPGRRTTPATLTAAKRRAIPFEDLAPVDRRIVRMGVGEDYEGRTGFGSSFPYVFENESAKEASELLSRDTHYVTYKGQYLSIYHDDTGETAVTTYRYTLPRIAGDPDAFVAHVEREHVLDLDAADPSAGEREVFEQAIDGVVERESPFSDAVSSLLDRLRSHQTNPLNGAVYARYEGEVYRVTLTLAVP